jgi:hypothetical protein
MSIFTFFAALRHKLVNFPTLKLSVSAIIYVGEIVGADSQRAHIRKMKKLTIASFP